MQNKQKLKSSYSIVEIYEIAMAQAKLAGSHIVIDVSAVSILCEKAGIIIIRFEDINLDAPDILISPSFSQCNRL
jgi:hypothetical protein